jgi:hypothetical protein
VLADAGMVSAISWELGSRVVDGIGNETVARDHRRDHGTVGELAALLRARAGGARV